VLSEVQIAKCEITPSVCTLEGTYTRASGIMGYFPHLLKYQNFWAFNSTLKEVYFISEACLDVLLFEL
jgi:hypothetical protein